MNTNELTTLLNDLNEQLEDTNKNIEKHIGAGNTEAVQILEDVWHSINDRIEDVEERIEASKVRKVRSQTEKLMSENID